jgi:DNA-binding MarR family transcriptional regulator
MVDGGFIRHERCDKDRRAVRVSLTEEGQQIREVVRSLYERHILSIEKVADINAAELEALSKSLTKLERFWTDQILYRL